MMSETTSDGPESTGPGVARVLVVDDQEALRLAYARVLARRGFSVETAADGEAALAQLRDKTYDAVLSDIGMPGLSGIDLVQRLRVAGDDVPVVLMTGDPHLETAVEAVEHGVTRYLTKPVEIDTLVSSLRGAIRLHGLARARRLALDNECLRSLIAELNRARVAEQAASSAKTVFLQKMSHELRTPLALVIGFTELALEGELSREQHDYLVTSRRSAEALLVRIESILELASLEGQRASLEAGAFATKGMIAATAQPLVAAAKGKGIAMTVNVHPEVPPVLIGDARKLGQVLGHLAGNAIKFTPAGGTIEVWASVASRAEAAVVLRVAVVDSGIGIPEAVQRQILQPFVQGDDSASRTYGGHGLGLSISALLAQLMGGALAVESAPGKGTTVTFAAKFATPMTLEELPDSP